MLTERMLSLLQRSCEGVFAQARSRRRASELSLGILCSCGRRTLSRAICAVGRQDQDWSADYKVYSRSPWDADRLFDPVMEEYLHRYPKGPISVAFDDTKLQKSGRKIQSDFWQREPLSPHARTYYRQPAYLLTTDNNTHATVVIQAYFDRWQIEVNHWEQKDILGVGQAQVWSPRSIPRQPAFAVASYSLLLLASLLEFAPGRTDHFIPLPKCTTNAKRPSALDLITLLRKEINETSPFDPLCAKITRNSVSYAYT